MAREEQSFSFINEACRIILVVIGLLVLLSLISYHPTDPSFDVAANGEQRNWIGAFGANLSVRLFQIFGLAAFLVPVIIAWGGWRVLKQRRWQPSLLKMVAFILLLGSVTALLGHPRLAGSSLTYLAAVRYHNAGGLLGYYLFDFTRSGLQTVGATIVWCTLLLISLMGTLQFSLEERISQLPGGDGLFGWLYRVKDWRDARAERRRQAAAETALSITVPEPKAVTVKAKSEKSAVADTPAPEVPAVGEDTKPPVIVKPEPPATKTASAGDSATAANGTTKRAKSDAAVKPTTSAEPSAVAPTLSGEAPASATESPQVAAEILPPPKIDIKPPTRDIPAVVQPPITNSRSASATARGESAQGKTAPDSASSLIERRPPARLMEVNDFDSDSPSFARSNRREREPKRRSVRSGQYQLPASEMLNAAPAAQEISESALLDLSRQLQAKCAEFSVAGHVAHIRPGPVVTTFEFKPDPGVKYSRITGLVDDLCLAMKAESIRIDRIPGKSTVGIEVPNAERATIFLRDIIESKAFQQSKSKLTIALGKSIGGEIYIADLTKMPHLLIAGATGAGKSVGLNSIVMSILYKATPEEVKFIMVDPKRLELGLYDGIPHLLTPIVTDPKRASFALRWTVNEMENRYKLLAGFGVRNIDQYNREVSATVDRNLAAESDELPKPLPYIVVVIDELADLMMVASNDVETSITRLAQMARAVGIHLILATQRPSVDVITGLIKANFPSRIAFRVSSKVDSRTIIDGNGAEQLLGQGDMLFLPPGTSRLVRVHGSFVDEKEINRVIEHIKQQAEPVYDETITMSEKEAESVNGGTGERDEYYREALQIVVQMGRASTSVLQRRLHIGYGRAAAILDQMEQEGLVGPSEGSRPREVRPEAKAWLERVDQMEEEEL